MTDIEFEKLCDLVYHHGDEPCVTPPGEIFPDTVAEFAMKIAHNGILSFEHVIKLIMVCHNRPRKIYEL